MLIPKLMNSLGHSGVVPCPVCININKDGRGQDMLPLTNLECHRWVLHTDKSVRDLQGHLREQKGLLGKTAYHDFETSQGYHYNARAIINHETLAYKAISTLMSDWPHIYFITGLYKREVDAFVDLARTNTPRHLKAVFGFGDMAEYFHQWTWPARWMSCRRIYDNDKLAACASEQLSSVGVLGKLFRDIVLAEPAFEFYHRAARSMIALCDAIELLQCASRKLVGHQELHNGIMQHLRLHLEVYGDEHWAFKHHQAAHIALMYKLIGHLFDTLVTERKHKEPKRFAMSRVSRIGYEKGLMEEITLQHLHNWRAWRIASLKNAHALPKTMEMQLEELFPNADSILVSVEYVSLSGMKFHRGDVAILGHKHERVCGEIWYHFDVDGVLWSCLSIWPLVRLDGDRYATHSVCDNPRCVPASDLLDLVTFRKSGRTATVILPLAYRIAMKTDAR